MTSSSPTSAANAAVVIRTYLSDNCVTGVEFLRAVRMLARARNWPCTWRPDLGKGSHGVLIVNGRRTVVRHLSDELKLGTLHAMLKQLGLSQSEIRQGKRFPKR